MKGKKKAFLSFALLLFVFSSFKTWADNYYICVASYWNESFAEQLVENLEKEGVEAVIDELEKGYDTYYRVLININFETAEEAKAKCAEISRLPIIEDLKLDGLWICKGNKIREVKPKIEPAPVAEIIVPEEPVVEPEEQIEEEPALEIEPVLEVMEVVEVLPEVEPFAEVEPAPVEEEPLTEIQMQPVVLTVNEEKEITISEEKPYSVLVRSYKEVQSAENDKRRLRNSDIDAYILKAYDEKELFSFNLMAGAFASKEETLEMQDKLEELGIEDTSICEFDDISESLEKYDEIIEGQEVVFETTTAQMPENFSEEVQFCIRQFPVNKDFQIMSLEIWDLENAKKHNYNNIPEVLGADEKAKALSIACYRDDLFGKDITVIITTGEKGSYDEPSIETEDLEELRETLTFAGDIDFATAEGIVKCKLYYKDSNYILNGVNEDKSFQIGMIAENFTLRQFNEFLNNCYSDSSYLVYPQLRKSLFVLPVENKFVHRDFIRFELSKVGMNYAKDRGYADWAMAIVGHWTSDSYYFQDDVMLTTGFFDLDYDYNAKTVHSMFMDVHRASTINALNHSVEVNGTEGWFILNRWNDFDELSFATKSYIIALDSYGTDMLSEDDLIDVANDLQIWE